ncbi:hypothetical protein [Sulfurimonas sp.]|uniref:hypothetical protein n=1 Tax=Sulfurimonas sp. TaxID=2022749 RepID=UPI003563189A
MVLGEYKVRGSHLVDFNNKFFNYGEDLKNFVFDFKSKNVGSTEITYIIEFYDGKSSFKDAITKSVSLKKQNWFEDFFEKI